MGLGWRVGALAPLIALGLGCKSGESTAPSPTDLAGTWTASSDAFISKGTPNYGTVDLVADNVVTLKLNADQTFEYRITPRTGGGAPQVLTGTYQVMGIDLMRITPGGAGWYWAWDFSLSGNTLHIWCSDAMDINGMHWGYDFNHDGVWEPASWDLVFTR
jgi:hypothetical protein